MKSTLNKSILAVLYYNRKQPNRYDLNDQTDRQRAERAFNKTTIEPTIFALAVADYKALLQAEIDSLCKDVIF
ncbi:MAG: hypothetical protein ACOVQA_08810 [Thermoflexibacteraceae bacterium]|jgi:hypothetical protein